MIAEVHSHLIYRAVVAPADTRQVMPSMQGLLLHEHTVSLAVLWHLRCRAETMLWLAAALLAALPLAAEGCSRHYWHRGRLLAEASSAHVLWQAL